MPTQPTRRTSVEQLPTKPVVGTGVAPRKDDITSPSTPGQKNS